MRQRLFRFKPFISDFRLLYTSLVSRLANFRIFLLVFPLLMFTPLYQNKWRRGSGAPLGRYTLGIWPLITLNQTDLLLRAPVARWLLPVLRPRRRSRGGIPIYLERRR